MLLLELQTSDAGSAVTLGFLFHNAVPAYAGNENVGSGGIITQGMGLGSPEEQDP
jgi:hypothetical protein